MNTQSTTSNRNHSPQLFHISHPFHPLYGQAFKLVQVGSNWGEERTYYVDANGQLKPLPTGWTSLAAPAPFVTMTTGQAAFRFVDLLALVHLIRDMAK